MIEKQKDNACPLCKCETCCNLISESTALTFEGADYVRYFCGTECYETWQKLQHHKDSNENQESNDDQ